MPLAKAAESRGPGQAQACFCDFQAMHADQAQADQADQANIPAVSSMCVAFRVVCQTG
jgi:hypothetical protein